MVKAKLPEAKFSVLSLNGGGLGRYGSSQDMDCHLKMDGPGDYLTRVVINHYKGMNLQPKGDMCTISDTMGWPTASNRHGHRVFIKREGSLVRETVEIRFSCRRYSTGRTSNAADRLNQLIDRCKAHPHAVVDRKVYDILCDPAFLAMAYDRIKSRPGKMTPGVSPTTLDGVSWDVLTKISDALRDESFQFAASRRISVPKPTGGKRPLTIGPPRDKIVQEAIRLILNAIYEPTFKDTSHGFRPNKSCHTALQMVFRAFKPCTWVIEGDISKCFDSIDHHKLMALMEQKIVDRKFTKLIWKCLKAGYFEFKQYAHNIAGTPQGTIISPILCNIFLHQLDDFMANRKESFDLGTRARNTKEYEVGRHKLKVAKRDGRMTDFLSRYKDMRASRPVMPPSDPMYKRLAYVRYADDWVIGIRGSMKDAETVLAEVTDLCGSIGLKVSETKTKITNLIEGKVQFLGVQLSRAKHVKTAAKSSSHKQRQNRQLRFTVSLDRLRKKLSSAGFYKNGKATPRYLWMHLEHDQIIHLYNAVFRGFINYYSFVHNYSQMVALLNLYLRRSCAKLLAAKFSMSSTAKVFSKFGKALNHGSVKFFEPSKSSSILDFKLSASPIIQALGKSQKERSVARCSICDSAYRVEIW